MNMEALYDRLLAKEDALSLVGLGYVGMPIAVAFAKKLHVIGFDLNPQKIDLYKAGIEYAQFTSVLFKGIRAGFPREY